MKREAVSYAYATGKPKFSQAVNGVQTWYAYEATTEHGAIHKHTVTTKANGELVAAQSRKTETSTARLPEEVLPIGRAFLPEIVSSVPNMTNPEESAEACLLFTQDLVATKSGAGYSPVAASGASVARRIISLSRVVLMVSDKRSPPFSFQANSVMAANVAGVLSLPSPTSSASLSAREDATSFKSKRNHGSAFHIERAKRGACRFGLHQCRALVCVDKDVHT